MELSSSKTAESLQESEVTILIGTTLIGHLFFCIVTR